MEKHTIPGVPPEPSDAQRIRAAVRTAISLISGKWKLEILWLLNDRTHRFGELRKALPGITQHMLTAQLRELEASGLVSRKIYAEGPIRVEYSMTDDAKRLRPVFGAIIAWAEGFEQRDDDVSPPPLGS